MKNTILSIGVIISAVILILAFSANLRPSAKSESNIVQNAVTAIHDNQIFIQQHKPIYEEYNRRLKNNESQVKILSDAGYTYDWTQNLAVKDEEAFLAQRMPVLDLRK